MKTMYFIFKILIVSLLIISTIITGGIIYYKKNLEQIETNNETELVLDNQIQDSNIIDEENVSQDNKVELQGGGYVKIITEIDDWRLVLVNSENPLPENFTIELAKISSAKEFDARASEELLRYDTSYEGCWCF